MAPRRQKKKEPSSAALQEMERRIAADPKGWQELIETSPPPLDEESDEEGNDPRVMAELFTT